MFNFEWQSTFNGNPQFDRCTLKSLEENPLFLELIQLLQETRENNRDKQNNFFVWTDVFAFIIFAFDELEICDLREQFEDLYEGMHCIAQDFSDPHKHLIHDENYFYDLIVNDFLLNLRMVNVQKLQIILDKK